MAFLRGTCNGDKRNCRLSSKQTVYIAIECRSLDIYKIVLLEVIIYRFTKVRKNIILNLQRVAFHYHDISLCAFKLTKDCILLPQHLITSPYNYLSFLLSHHFITSAFHFLNFSLLRIFITSPFTTSLLHSFTIYYLTISLRHHFITSSYHYFTI